MVTARDNTISSAGSKGCGRPWAWAEDNYTCMAVTWVISGHKSEAESFYEGSPIISVQFLVNLPFPWVTLVVLVLTVVYEFGGVQCMVVARENKIGYGRLWEWIAR